MSSQADDEDQGASSDHRGPAVHEGRIVGETSGPGLSVPLACGHGCTCRLHDQVRLVPGIPDRRPEDLDHGEMAALVIASREATILLDGFHDRLRLLREAVVRSHRLVRDGLDTMRALEKQQLVVHARTRQVEVRRRLSDLEPDQLRRPSTVVRWAGAVVIAGIALFDTLFFFQSLLDVLAVPAGTPWALTAPNALPGLVLALGLIIAGGILAGPCWRLSRGLRSAPEPGWSRTRRALRIFFRTMAVVTLPLVLLGVLGLWASIRGQMAIDAAFLPPDWTVVVLLLSLSLIAMAIEIRLGNPFAKEWHDADHALERAVAQHNRLRAEVNARIADLEVHWRNLRSARDEMLSLLRVELARPWEDLILPARLRHRKAGDLPPRPAATDWSNRETLSVFAGVDQPVPGPGPLAEVIRQIEDYRPEPLGQELQRIAIKLDGQVGVDLQIDLREPTGDSQSHTWSLEPR
jgi:hypothetical protein